jgi:hypothetical protein
VRNVQYVIGADRRSPSQGLLETEISMKPKSPRAKTGATREIVVEMCGSRMMAKENQGQRTKGVAEECDLDGNLQASSSETAEYLAQMASELVLLARNARLERVSMLLDLVRREAESAAV